MGAWVHGCMGAGSMGAWVHRDSWALTRGPWTYGPMDLLLSHLCHHLAEQLAQARESLVPREVLLDVADGAGNVLDVHGIPPDARLVAERPERFQVWLQRHHVEPRSI